MSFLVDLALRVSELVLVTLGVSLSYLGARFLNLALVQYASFAAYACLWLTGLGVPLVAAVAPACGASAILAVVLHRLVFARLLEHGAALALIGALAVSMVLRAVLQAVGGTAPSAYPLALRRPLHLGSVPIDPVQAIVLLACASTVLLVAWTLFLTPVGRLIRAVAADATLAAASGLDQRRLVDVICGLGGAIAGLGGIAVAAGGQVSPVTGDALLLPVFAAAIVGGLTSPMGAVLGALLLAACEVGAATFNVGPLLGRPIAFVPAGLAPAAGFTLLVATLLVRPGGLVGGGVRRV